MSTKKSKNESDNYLLNEQLRRIEQHIRDLQLRMDTMEYQSKAPNTIDKYAQEALDTAQRLLGAVHQEAVDFVDYLRQARQEIDEFKETTTKEIKALIKRTKKYSVDDRKDILLEDD